MTQVNILSCTDRPGSRALKIAGNIQPYYEDLNVDARIYSLMKFPHDETVGGRYGKDTPEIDQFNREVLSGDGLVMVVPEYNGGFPGILKVFFDYLPHPGAVKQYPIALIGEAAGYFGAMRPVEHLQDLLIYRKAHVYPERVFIPKVREVLDNNDEIRDQSKVDRLKSQAEGFVNFVENVKKKKPVG